MTKEKKIIGAKYIIPCCPKCKSENAFQYQVLASYPPIYCYLCKDCNSKWQLSEELPRTEYVFEGDTE